MFVLMAFWVARRVKNGDGDGDGEGEESGDSVGAEMLGVEVWTASWLTSF